MPMQNMNSGGGNDAASGFIGGAQARQEMVMKAADLEKQQYELEQQKQQNFIAKNDKILEDVQGLRVVPEGAAKEMMKNRIKLNAKTMNIPIDDAVVEMMGNPDNHVEMGLLLNQISELKTKPDQLAAAYQQLGGLYLDPVKAQLGLHSLREKAILAKLAHEPKEKKPGGDLTPAQEVVDKKFGADYADYKTMGGEESLSHNLQALEDVRDQLKDSGGTGGPTNMLWKGAREKVNPKAVAMQEKVEKIITQSLRQTFGPQFTEREGQNFIDRSYNINLSPAENVKKLNDAISELKDKAQAKASAAKYYEANGTLKRYVDKQNPVAVAKNRSQTARQKLMDMGMSAEDINARVAAAKESKKKQLQDSTAKTAE